MYRIAPRHPQPPAHCQTRSNSQTLDQRLELVGKLEGCIGKVLEATKAYKLPQQHTAHQHANQMFQQRVMASRGGGGGGGQVGNQDWLGTMMQCLNESMRAQQSSFVRNTTLDVALRTFATGIFEALGPAYFQEPVDKYMAASSKPKSPQNNTIAGHDDDALGHSGIPSPPREMGPNQGLVQRPGTQNIPPPPTHPSPCSCTHHQILQTSAHVLPAPQHHQMRPMPILQRPLPPAHPPGRRLKRPSPTEPLDPLVQKRTYTSEALRQAAGSMGPPLSLAQAQTSHSNAPQLRPCIDFWDIQRQRDSQRRQAVLGYGGKWYVFQCHRHQDVLLFKTAEGARHHMITRHAMPNQHIDFLDIVQELGVEVINCDVARAEKNNLEAVHLWNQSTSSPVAQQGAAEVQVNASLPTAQLESPSTVLLSEDEVGHDATAGTAKVTIKREKGDVDFSYLATKVQPHSLTTAPSCSTQSSEPASLPTESLETSRKSPISASKKSVAVSQGPLAQQVARIVKSPERDELVASPEESAKDGSGVTGTEKATGTPEHVEHIPDVMPNSPESSDLSEPSSLANFDSFETQSMGSGPKVMMDGELDEGEIDESCIQAAPCSPAMSEKMTACPASGNNNNKKRRISAAGSAPSSGPPRKKLPSTPKSAQKKRRQRRSFGSPSQETGPSAHDQFKTRACKKCAERFYFRAQLAMHMQNEHPEIITVE